MARRKHRSGLRKARCVRRAMAKGMSKKSARRKCHVRKKKKR